MRFPVLTNPGRYPVEFQSDMVIALCVVHNYIRIHGGCNDEIEQRANATLYAESESDDNQDRPENDLISNEGSRHRDAIAHEMWNDYQKYLAARKAKRQTHRS